MPASTNKIPRTLARALRPPHFPTQIDGIKRGPLHGITLPLVVQGTPDHAQLQSAILAAFSPGLLVGGDLYAWVRTGAHIHLRRDASLALIFSPMGGAPKPESLPFHVSEQPVINHVRARLRAQGMIVMPG